MYKILILDDEPCIVNLLKKFLSLKGFDPVGVGSGKEALEIMKSNSDLNLIITDMKMPDFSGIDILREMKAINKNIPIIILSGCPITEGSEYDELKNLNYNPDEIFCKPMDLFALLDIINKKLL